MQTPDILADIEKSLIADAKVLPHRSNWATVLLEKCLRKQVYYRTDWDKQSPPDARLQGIFNTGRKIEKQVKSILNEIGMHAKPMWELVDTGVKLNDAFLNDHQIGGEPDLFLKASMNGERPEILGVVEVKGFNPNLFKQVNTIDDFHKYKWMERYLGQLTIYELGSNFPVGWFLIVNKANWWEYKFIEYPLDYEFADRLIEAADFVNLNIENKTLPDKLNDPDECPKCPFNSICMPCYETSGNLKTSEDENLEAVLTRLRELEPAEEEIKDLKKMRDAALVKGQDLCCGKFLITWKQIESNRKAQEAKTITSWRKKIVYAE
ncbi:hypothetical protein LCGC14_0421070 [marine sediment metagenome]|uniref:YqaJ viral recombinase domain-containing protein n=1 Tax=marine sediment metagenome TaxID=412755 RepID=A0A0F9SQS3_9ZZZZ